MHYMHDAVNNENKLHDAVEATLQNAGYNSQVDDTKDGPEEQQLEGIIESERALVCSFENG